MTTLCAGSDYVGTCIYGGEQQDVSTSKAMMKGRGSVGVTTQSSYSLSCTLRPRALRTLLMIMQKYVWRLN